MLVRFVASNFLSLKEEVEFNMLTGDFKAHQHHVYKAGKVEVLKAAAIYGANGAGKSNLVKAIYYLKLLVRSGVVSESVNRKKFKLDPTYRHKPVRLEIEFFTNKKLYSYGIAIDGTNVLEEWLYEVSGDQKEDRLVFERITDKKNRPALTFAKEYQASEKQKLLIELLQENLLKEDQLLLGKHGEIKIEEITQAREWIDGGLHIIFPHDTYQASLLAFLDKTTDDMRQYISALLSNLDTGVSQFWVQDIDLSAFSDISYDRKEIEERLTREPHVTLRTEGGPVTFTHASGGLKAKRMEFIHQDPSVSFDLYEESDGTQKLIDYLSAVYMILMQSVTFVIDEIDQSVHVGLLKTLLRKVMDEKENRGQLIFTTHESNLLDLDIFRQDEIWFAEKERETGATHFYSLSEFEPGYGSDIEKGYLNGRFGAIPFLGNLETLNWHPYAETE